MRAKHAAPTKDSFAPEPAHAFQPESGTRATFSACLEPETALSGLTALAARRTLASPTPSAETTYPFASARMDTTHMTLSASAAAQRSLALAHSHSLECSFPTSSSETKNMKPSSSIFTIAMLPLC